MGWQPSDTLLAASPKNRPHVDCRDERRVRLGVRAARAVEDEDVPRDDGPGRWDVRSAGRDLVGEGRGRLSTARRPDAGVPSPRTQP